MQALGSDQRVLVKVVSTIRWMFDNREGVGGFLSLEVN
jgi:hypothetical protein